MFCKSTHFPLKIFPRRLLKGQVQLDRRHLVVPRTRRDLGKCALSCPPRTQMGKVPRRSRSLPAPGRAHGVSVQELTPRW